MSSTPIITSETVDDDAERGFKTFALADLYALQLPEVTWVVQDLIPMASLVLLVGHPKAGKSLLMIDLAASIAAGEPFLGRETRQGPALYLPAEDALPLVRERFKSRCGEQSDIPLSVLPRAPYADQVVRIDDPVSIQDLADTIEREQPRVLILDPFRELHQLDENDAEQMARVLRPLRQIAHETGTAIALVHHRSKHGSNTSLASRGSSAIAGAADAIITLDGNELGDQIDSGKHVLTLSIEGRYGPRQAFGAQLFDGLRWELADPSTLETGHVQEVIVRCLDGRPDQQLSPDELATATGRSIRTVQNALPQLVSKGLVVRAGSGHRNDPYTYFRSAPIPS